jgi:hypothetical protein
MAESSLLVRIRKTLNTKIAAEINLFMTILFVIYRWVYNQHINLIGKAASRSIFPPPKLPPKSTEQI